MGWMAFMEGALGQVQKNMEEKKSLDRQEKLEEKEDKRWESRAKFQDALAQARERAKEQADLASPKKSVFDPKSGKEYFVNSRGEKVGVEFDNPEAKAKFATEKEEKRSLDAYRDQQMQESSQRIAESKAREATYGKAGEPKPDTTDYKGKSLSQISELNKQFSAFDQKKQDGFEISPEKEKMINSLREEKKRIMAMPDGPDKYEALRDINSVLLYEEL